jgi:hypothetical protein
MVSAETLWGEWMRRLGHATADLAMRYQRAETDRDRALAKAMSDDALNGLPSDTYEPARGVSARPPNPLRETDLQGIPKIRPDPK